MRGISDPLFKRGDIVKNKYGPKLYLVLDGEKAEKGFYHFLSFMGEQLYLSNVLRSAENYYEKVGEYNLTALVEILKTEMTNNTGGNLDEPKEE